MGYLVVGLIPCNKAADNIDMAIVIVVRSVSVRVKFRSDLSEQNGGTF